MYISSRHHIKRFPTTTATNQRLSSINNYRMLPSFLIKLDFNRFNFFVDFISHPIQLFFLFKPPSDAKVREEKVDLFRSRLRRVGTVCCVSCVSCTETTSYCLWLFNSSSAKIQHNIINDINNSTLTCTPLSVPSVFSIVQWRCAVPRRAQHSRHWS